MIKPMDTQPVEIEFTETEVELFEQFAEQLPEADSWEDVVSMLLDQGAKALKDEAESKDKELAEVLFARLGDRMTIPSEEGDR